MAGMMGMGGHALLGLSRVCCSRKRGEAEGRYSGRHGRGRATYVSRPRPAPHLYLGLFGFLCVWRVDSLESLFYRDVLNVDIVGWGWLSSVVGLTSSVGAFILTKLSARHVNLRLLLGALMAVGIGSMVYVGTDMLGVAIIGQAINGLAWGFLEPLQMILIQERADIKYLGRITGFVRFGLMSAGVLPLLAAPFLAEALGVQAVLFGASTIIALVGTLFFVTQGRRQRR